MIRRLGVEVGRPLSDMRDYVATMRTAAEHMGGLPPVDLAALRDKMVALAVEVGDGAVWANASRSRMAHSLSLVGDDRLAGGFEVGNMIPTVIDDDVDAARARNRTTLPTRRCGSSSADGVGKTPTTARRNSPSVGCGDERDTSPEHDRGCESLLAARAA